MSARPDGQSGARAGVHRRRATPIGLTLTAALLAAACTQDAEPEAAPEPLSDAGEVHGADVAVSPYVIRLDSERDDVADFRLTEEETGVHVVTGPAGIAYHPDETVASGNFTAEATFTQYGASVGFREAFGLFVGGRDLDSPDQEYTYFLVRTTGDILIKRRVGEVTEVIVDWAPHEAVRRLQTEGDETVNEMSITATDGRLLFQVNGETVHEMEVARGRPYGVAGLRINHFLDVRVSDWGLRARDMTE